MISKEIDVEAYIAELPAERRTPLEKLRDLCRRHLAGYEEGMAYGMPAYKRNGTVEVAFANQKRYIALYVLKKDVLDEFRNALTGANLGKGCIRFSNPDKMDFELLKRLLTRAASSPSLPC